MKPYAFLRTTAVALAALALGAAAHAADLTSQLGIQTWTLRNMKFEQVVEFAKTHGIKNLQMIGNHMDPKAPVEETKRKKAVLEAAGLKVYTFGVAGTSLDKEENRRLFEFAKLLDIKVIVVEPNDFEILDNLEELVKEYDIRIAIHNHGIRSLYGNPAVVRALLKHRDPRMGVCMDAGWIASTGMDPTKVFKEYEGRVFDIHLKDKRVEKTQGDDVSFDTHIGEGQGRLQNLLAELKASNWPGVLAIETDSGDFAKDPTEFIKHAKAFVEQYGK
ncbi:MAG: sugar phosphate isomerase/epimerase [Verrucomicrobiales bacterium]|nr:sugar phosphate isomerase/epimerase [Verrucomicrobiales bacterium]